jgi:hypothetical protein
MVARPNLFGVSELPVQDPATDHGYHGGLVGWAKLLLGVLLLAVTIFVLGQGYTPPGPAGEVFRNNLLHGIDATPLFYTEVKSLMAQE